MIDCSFSFDSEIDADLTILLPQTTELEQSEVRQMRQQGCSLSEAAAFAEHLSAPHWKTLLSSAAEVQCGCSMQCCEKKLFTAQGVCARPKVFPILACSAWPEILA